MDLGNYIFTVGLDDTSYKSGMKKMDTSLASFGKNASKTGSALTKKLSLPIVALGLVSIKAAADFEVASRKFAGAFKGAEKEASSAVENLNKNFGIATSEATSLLAFTGDLLKGFGATSKEAINLSNNTNELAAALAAYNGVPVARTSAAITKALLGEREGLKLLGVTIKETDLKQRLLEKGQKDLTGQALLLAKAEATLELAMEQSGDAVKNFAKNTDTLSFQSQALIGDLKDLGVQFGTILLPVIKEMVGGLSEFTEWVGDLDDDMKQWIITLAGFAAVAGPVIGAIGGISTALAFLAANPAVAALTAVTAIIVAVGTIGKIAEKKHVEKLSEQFGELAKSTGVAESELAAFSKQAELVAIDVGLMQWADSMEDVATQIGFISEETGLTIEQITQIGIESDNINEKFKGSLKTIQEQSIAAAEVTTELTEQESLTQQKLSDEEKISAELAEQQRIRQETETTYQSQWELNKSIIEGSRTELELLEEQIETTTRLGDASAQYNEDRILALQILQARKAELLDEEAQAVIDFEETQKERRLEQAEEKLELLEIEREELLIRAEEMGAETHEIEAYYDQARADLRTQEEEDKAQKRKDEVEAEKKKFQDMIKITKQFSGMAGGILLNLLAIKTNIIAKETQARIDGLDRESLGEEEYAKRVGEIQAEAALKQWEIEKQVFKVQQVTQTINSVMAGATAILQGYAQLGPIGGSIFAGFAAALTATELALIASQVPPPRPQLAEGGIVNPQAGGVPVTIGEAGDSEAVIPLNDAFYNRLAEAATGSAVGEAEDDESGSQPVILQNIMDGSILSETVVGYINNNQAGTQIKSKAIVNR